MYGELVPVGGGDVVPLLKRVLILGRRETCDIVLRFPNISGEHCRLTLDNGYWYVKDLNSRNGLKVNNKRVGEKRLDPGAELSIAKHAFRIAYIPAELGAVGPPPAETEAIATLFNQSLLEKAGLSRRRMDTEMEDDEDVIKRYDPRADRPLEKRKRDPNEPL